jgi:hypothetical protein
MVIMAKEKREHLFRLIAALDSHFAADDAFPADGDRWRALKRHVVRMEERLELALGELVSGAPANQEKEDTRP